VIVSVEGALLAQDTIETQYAGLYEIAGVGMPSPELRLVNVDNSGNQLTYNEGPTRHAPLFGGFREGPGVAGTAYHAFSENGETVFFTATPTAGQQPTGGQPTVYARVHGRETIAVSNPTPSECAPCNPTPAPATYRGASANGQKVFFTTTQQLVSSDTDSTGDLYEYDFAPGHHLVQLSRGGTGDLTPGNGANVQGVVRASTDGSHVYFVARGVLTSIPNSLGQLAQPGAENLYGVDTNTGETKFVAALSPVDAALWAEADNNQRDAQTTTDGRFLVFSTFAHLAPEDANNGQAAYRYDFQTGELTWLSHPAPGFPALNEGKGSVIASINGEAGGSRPDLGDWSRAITPDGHEIVFTSEERLQANDVNNANDVYLWHDGVVSLISDGRDTLGVNARISSLGPKSEPWAGISESGSDIFFFTQTQLVGQDTDSYQDLYDARIAGGFPTPVPAPSCTGEEWTCQGQGSAPAAPPKPEGSSIQQAGENLAPPFTQAPAPTPKPLTRQQKLSRALKACRKIGGRRKRGACERQARSTFGSTKKAKPTKRGGR
jgi:hypothetical protein